MLLASNAMSAEITLEELREKMPEYIRTRFLAEKRTRVRNLVKVTSGWETDIYSFVSERWSDDGYHSDDLILRIYSGDYSKEKSTREYKVMSRLYEAGFSVPKVYHLETDTSIFDRPFVIMERIDGQSMGEILTVSSEAKRKDLIDLFCRMFVDLHRLDIRPFLLEPSIVPDPSAYDMESKCDHLTGLLQRFRHVMTSFENRERAFALFSQVLDWLDGERSGVLTCGLSLVHLDYHPYNVLIRRNGQAFVIDWTNSTIADYRIDLGWTLLLVSTSGNPEMRDHILGTYENLAQSRIRNIEYFEVLAAARRLGSLYLSLTQGAEKLGMRPEVATIVKHQTSHVKAVIEVLRDRTNIETEEFFKLLGV